jgi:protein-tyrosine phosphatase
VSSGAVETRRLVWPGCRNVRDLGGLPVVTGGLTRSGALIRADSLNRLTAAGIAAVRARGMARILDLRSVWELPDQPHPFHDDPIYRLLPFIDDNRDKERNRAGERTRADLYRGSVDRNSRQIAAAVAAIADAPRGAVVIHCLSGVDRTGMLAAIVLDAIKVERSAIAADYASSEQELGSATPRPPDEQNGAEERPRPGSSPGLLAPAGPETIIEVLEHIDGRHGGVRTYLKRNGVTGRTLTKLRERLA